MKATPVVAFVAALLAVAQGQLSRLVRGDGHTAVVSSAPGCPCREEYGRLLASRNGQSYEQKYVLRFPPSADRWNGGLVIGLHGETALTERYGADGSVIGTHETQLDDMIGRPALNQRFAYASVERVGGRADGLWLTYEFLRLVGDRLRAELGRVPAPMYAAGWSTGGTAARYVSEDPASPFKGALVIAGVGGNSKDTTHRPLVPTIEIVGTADTPILQAVLAYRAEVQDPGASGAVHRSGLVFRHRQQRVGGAPPLGRDEGACPTGPGGLSARPHSLTEDRAPGTEDRTNALT